MAESSVSLHKGLLRDHLRKIRRQKSQVFSEKPAAYQDSILALCDSSVQTVAAYLPMTGEPPIRDALATLHRRGIEVLVPVVEKKRTLSWVVWSPDIEHPVSAFGIEEPTGPRFDSDRFLAADLHLIPALAYDLSGRRLGQGGAFYDTLLAQANTRDSSYVGIVFSHEVLDAVPAEPHDSALGFVLTEKGLRRLG